MNDNLAKIALPAGGILSAQLTPGNPREITLRFDDPIAALRFSASVRHEIKPKADRYHHVIINEELGDRSFAQHFVLITTGEADPQACAQHMAATLYSGGDEDAPVPTPNENGYYLLDDARVSVLRLKALSDIDGQAMARHLPVCHSEDMSINQVPAQTPDVERG